MRKYRTYLPLLGLFILLLFCFLIIVSALVASQQREILRNKTHYDIASALDLMADASREALLKSDYVTVRNLLNQWGQHRKEYHELRIVAPNGFIIAKFENPEEPVGPPFSLTREVMIENRHLATIYLTGDYCEDEKIIAGLSYQLLVTAVILIVMLGAALWFLFRHAAIEPLEEEVKKRTQALAEANHELEQLTNNSPS